MSMLKTMDRRGTMTDVKVVYSSPTADRMIFRDALLGLAEKHPSLDLTLRYTDDEGMFSLEDDLDATCPDWTGRQTWACGPGPMLDAAEEHFRAHDVEDHLHLERFTLELGENTGEGGTVSFQNSGRTAEVDGSTTILEAGEKAGIGMPYGCRMGICHTCTLTLVSGSVTDVRNGDQFAQPTSRSRPASPSPTATAPSTSDGTTPARPSPTPPGGHVWRSPTSRSTHTCRRRTSRRSAPSSTPSARGSRSPATPTTRRTSSG